MLRMILNFKLSYFLYFLFILFGFYLVLRYPGASEQSGMGQAAESSALNLQQNNSGAASSPAEMQQVSEPEPADIGVDFEVGRSTICLDVENGEPLLEKYKINRNVDYVFCLTEISLVRRPGILYHRWVYEEEDEEYDIVRLKVTADSKSVWSRMEMNPSLAGNWRVEILSAEMEILDTVKFYLY